MTAFFIWEQIFTIPLKPYLCALMQAFEVVIGMEVHIRLATATKLFSSDNAAYGAEPNTHTTPITLAHPGTLPRLNKEAVAMAVKLGLACNCTINPFNYFARKHYFYPDSPKGFQITQHTEPVCLGGYIELPSEKKVLIHHIHLEEDAGKSIHDQEPGYSWLDYNRAGTPLMELVTEPCITSAEEAASFITELHRLVQWIDVCDGNMEEGSLKCDVNISARPAGDDKLGTKVEIKNVNSIRNIRKAIAYEAERIFGLLRNNEKIIQQTRSFDANTDTTFALREKEEANDYRYFPEPDLPPLQISMEFIQSIKDTLPELPVALKKRLQNSYQLNEYDAGQISMDKSTAVYFEAIASHTKQYKQAANWVNGALRQHLNEQAIDFNLLQVKPKQVAAVIELVIANTVSHTAATTKLFPELMNQPEADVKILAASLNIIQVSDSNELTDWVNGAMNKMPDKVLAYQKGKKGLIGLFMAEVKRMSGGKADPQATLQLLEKKLSQKS